MALRELDPSIYQRKIEMPGETVYELVTAEDKPRFGCAIVDIKESGLNVHHKTTEEYMVRNGTLEVTLDGEIHVVKVGKCIEILPGVEHKARSLGKDPARAVVISYPAWTPKDHHLVEQASD